MNKQQLAAKIWNSANKMRSKIEANEYKDYILGFIFYKFLSDKEVKYLKSIGYTSETLKSVTEDATDIVSYVQNNIGYFISYDNLFSTWLNRGSDFNAGEVTTALRAFSRLINVSHSKVFKNIFITLETGLSKLGDTTVTRTKAISDLIHLINDIPMDGKSDYDVLGFIYEYLISNFAANAGKKAGEFYTPHEVSLLMSEIVADHLKGRKEIKIYDPTSGSGSLLINIGKSVSKFMSDNNGIKYYAQEIKENTYNLTRMNLVMRGIIPDNIMTRNADTLEDDWPFFEENDPVATYDPLYVDAVVSNPPYSQHWNPNNKESDPRYKSYGLAPKGKADYAFLLHDLYHVKPDGIMTIVLPHGVLFRGGEEAEIRKNLIEQNKIDSIIGLPANIFFGTGIPTIIMVLKQKRINTDVLIVDASKGFEKDGKNNKLRACDIKKIVDVVTSRRIVNKFSNVVTREAIRKNDYNLNIPRYVDSSEKQESWDVYASMFGGIPANELNELQEYWTAFPNIRKDLFLDDESQYVHLSVDNIKTAISEHTDVNEFNKLFEYAFSNLDKYLYEQLIDCDQENINISKEEDVLSKNIFSRLANVPLVDVYDAYQILNDEWSKIACDLEIIQTEGFSATKQVDPNMVIKKKNNKDVEVQEGWLGRIIPFDLVQKSFFNTEISSIRSKENRLANIASEYEELLESLSEDDKQRAFVNEDNTEFVAKEVKKAIKANDVDINVLLVLKKYDTLASEEKKLKKEIKEKNVDLVLKTKSKIESLTDEEVREILKQKWISPIVSRLNGLLGSILNKLITKLSVLANKYAVTFEEVEVKILETEDVLSGMIDELEGNEFDKKGLCELKKLLGGDKDD